MNKNKKNIPRIVPLITEDVYHFIPGNKAVHLPSGEVVDAEPIKAEAKKTWMKITITT